jgi:predicted N-acyltransferase
VKFSSNDYVIRVADSPDAIDAAQWNALLATQASPTPFMRLEYLAALHHSGSATEATGWTPRFFTLWLGGALHAACVLYLKPHSYGEYVFDFAWANAYAQHGLAYYPKAVVAAPFTPVPGARLLARDADARLTLVRALVAWCDEEKLSSLHLLFGADDDVAACDAAGLMQRHTVQFHWTNCAPTLDTAKRFVDFDNFLASLSQDKRKKIRQERRKVADAGVGFRWARGTDISPADWDFFYRCYERTYLEHGNAPYLSRDFFKRMASTLPEAWLLFVAEREGQPIATSLIALGTEASGTVAYGRYWGALERVDCLHFEACYYQPLQWCIDHGVQRFEGGAQGEHKMARALMPVKTTSAHWLAHPAFADAVERFLEREGEGITGYMEDLERRTPFHSTANDSHQP